MTTATNNDMREIAIAKMISAIESAMENARKSEEDALSRIAYHAEEGRLTSSDVTNVCDDLKEAKAVQYALGEIAMWAQMVKQA